MQTKTVLVTGAAARIGAAIARALHADGMNVVIHYFRSSAAADALCDSLNLLRPGSASSVCADLLQESQYRPVIEQAGDRHGRLDVLINNASAFFPTSIGGTTSMHWDELLGTNLKAPYFLAQEAAPALRRSGGCIVNLADIHADRPLRNYGVYSIAKAGLVMLTKVLAKELAPEVRVNAVSPGAVLWPEHLDEGLRERVISHTMLKRAGNPDDVVRAVRFLIRDAGYVTGQILTVDGGRTLYS